MDSLYSGLEQVSLSGPSASDNRLPDADSGLKQLEAARAESWEDRIAMFLAELSRLQEECLRILRQRQLAVARWDLQALIELQTYETLVLQKLEDFQRRRTELLEKAASIGYSAETIRDLIRRLPASELSSDGRRQLEFEVERGSWHWQLLQHQALANWLLLQRTLLHLSQMLEIIATGGQTVPTYSIKGGTEEIPSSTGGGILIDRAI